MGRIIRSLQVESANVLRLPDLEEEILNKLQTSKIEAANIIDSARLEAEKILQSAKAKAQEIIEDYKRIGFEEGKMSGEKEGLEKAQEQINQQIQQIRKHEFEPLLVSLNNLLKELNEKRDEYLRSVRDDMAKFVILLCKKILKTELKTSAEWILKNIDYAIKYLAEKSCLTVLLNPDDLKLLEDTCPDEVKKIKDEFNLIFVGDKALQRGTCILKTPKALIDVSLEKQLDNIIDKLNINM